MDLLHIEGAEPCTFKKGEYLIHMDEKLEFVYYLIAGQVRREIITEYGVETMLSHKQCGKGISSVIGLLYLYNYDYSDVSRDNFIAESECGCVRIPVPALKAYLHERADLLEDIIRILMKESADMTDRYTNHLDRPVHMNFSNWMLQHLVEKDGMIYLPKEFSNIAIAKELGIHKVTVSRVLRALREEGTIEKTYHGQLVLNKEALEDYASGKKHLKY